MKETMISQHFWIFDYNLRKDDIRLPCAEYSCVLKKKFEKMKRSFAKMSCGDLLEKFDDLVKRLKAEFNEIIENERAKMRAEVEAYNAEKEQMQAVSISDDDIIHFNIGGQIFSTTRSTLCQVEGSLLTTMFSGRWEDNLKRDENGAIFFDFNPNTPILAMKENNLDSQGWGRTLSNVHCFPLYLPFVFFVFLTALIAVLPDYSEILYQP